MGSHRVSFAFAAATALTLAACGGSTGDPAATAGSPTSTERPATSAVAATTVALPPASEPTAATGTPSEVPADGDASLATLLVAQLDQPGTAPTAFGIASIDGDSTAVAVAGTVSTDDSTAVAIDARFHLGSDTKAMTAVVLASVLAERGFTLSATLADVLAGVTPTVTLDPGFASVTVAQLLAHRAGIVDDPLALDDPSFATMTGMDARDAGARQLLAATQQDPTRPYIYSNAGYAIAGWIAEQLAGESWEDLTRARVFEPLGMTCGFGAPTEVDEPIGHDDTGAPDGRTDSVPDVIGPAGKVACSMADWSAWARAALDLAEGRPSELLTADMAAQLFVVPDGGDYVSGWLVLPGPDGAVAYAHDGSNTHWLARIILVPAEDRALLIAANSGDDATSAAFDTLVGEVFDA